MPFVGSSQRELALAHLQTEAPLASEFNPELPPELSNVIRKVMSKRPNDRYKHADQLGHILQQLRDHQRSVALQTAAGRMAPPTAIGQQPAPQSRAPVASANAPNDPAPPLPLVPRRPAAAASAALAGSRSFEGPGTGAVPALPSRPGPLFNQDGTINVDATGGYSGPFVPQRQPKREGADIVTIILVILAFLAVAGLAPLYLLGVFPLL